MICRLCLEESDNNFEIFSKNGETEIYKAIAKYFHIEVQISDIISNIICAECWKHLSDFHTFYINIENKQQSLHTHLACEKIKEDIEDVQMEGFSNSFDTISPIDSKNVELCEPEIDLLVKPTIEAPDGLEIDEGYMKADEASIATDSLAAALHSSDDCHASDVNQFPMKTTKRRKCVTMKNLRTKTILNKKVSKTLIPTRKKRKEDSDERNFKKSSKEVDSKNEKKPETKELIRELDQFIAENTQLSCCLCSQSLTDFTDLKNHFRQAHNCVGYVPCCKTRFIRRPLYVDHLKLHKDPDYFKCNICNKQLASRHNYKNHMNTVHPNTENLLYACKFCPEKFARQHILGYHMKSRHTNTRDFICKTCNKGFKNSQILKQHERAVHMNAYELVCEICGKCFRTAQNFSAHAEAIHKKTHRPEVQCKICLKWLKSPQCLRKHTLAHEDQACGREFKCPQCGVGKGTRQALRDHVRYHHSDKVFTCTICSKEFKTQRALKEHESTHTGTYLYTCSFCPKSFRSHGNMHKHRVNSHLKEWTLNRSHPNEVTKSLLNAFNENENNQISEGQS